MTDQYRHLLALSAQIVSAHTGHNHVQTDVIPNMIRSVYSTLADLIPLEEDISVVPGNSMSRTGNNGHDETEQNHRHAVNIYVHPTLGQTVFDDHLICMEDGLSMKMLKRHLLTVHGMTPAEYRAKWGLPDDYPMVAVEYAKLRSSLALQSGLGLKQDDRTVKGRKNRRAAA